jgi:hypothetical protein
MGTVESCLDGAYHQLKQKLENHQQLQQQQQQQTQRCVLPYRKR